MFLNGVWRVLWGLSVITFIVQCRTIDFGGYISDKTVLNATDSVYEVRKDIIIEKDASLIIKPGVQLKFAPGVGIYVHRDGILEAKGSEYQKIHFTRLVEPWSPDIDAYSSSWSIDVRLVDGDSVNEGRLQIFHKGKWRSVCTNSKNWTQDALNVTCQQLGFSGGELYHWFPRNNDSSQLLYEDPQCTGNETSIFHCPNWVSRQLGSGVCDFHYDIGIRCDRHLSTESSSNWRGIKFSYAKSQDRKPIENKVNRLISLSSLEHVRIYHAGRDAYGNAVPALEVFGLPPVISNAEIKHSAFDAVHVVYPTDAFIFKNSTIASNRGHGIFVNSSVSQVTLSGMNIQANGGNGIHFVHHESFGTAPAFCKSASFGEEQIYPVRRSHVQDRHQFSKNCDQVFEVASRSGQVLTVNFMGFSTDISDPKYAACIDVFDGIRLLSSIRILNNTYPQSITSTRNKINLKYRTANRHDVSFVVEIVANQGRAYDLNVTDCKILSNHGKGIYIEGQRSGVLVNSSVLSANGHAAGLDISSGCGDVIVNNSVISNNNGDGINITYSGGFIHIDRSSIGSNSRRGISFWFNETSEYIALNHTVHITASEVVNNSLYGILVGNQCLSNSFWNISLNAIKNNKDSGILVESCWSSKRTAAQSNVLVTHNQFLESDHFALEMSPILHSHLLVEHNEFVKHNRGVIFINGLDDDEYTTIPAKAEIRMNSFTLNSGKFVANIGVCQGTSVQEIFFYKNELEGNSIKEPFPTLNPRSRVAAVVVVSSQNALIIRNRFDNPDSTYELGSHVEKHHVVVNASFNYWGVFNNVRKVYEKIFDRKDRYNLARVEFLPFLTVASDLDSTTAVSDNHERDKIIPFQTGLEIGGEVPGSIYLQRDTYIVKRDIYIRPGNGRLQIEPGAVLKFDQSIGMMVQGVLLSESNSNFSPITYTLNDNANRIREEANIRLSGPTEGLLEVFIDGNWGSVCDYGWDILDASIACNQMGLVLHPEDWLLEQSEFEHGSRFPIIVSNLQCTLQDTDITQCKSESDFENSCFTKVGLRCYHPSWSGLRLGMAAEESRLKNVIIQSAGLLDYATNSFKPALQIDFNKHILENLKINDNTDSGIGIMWNEMFVPQSRQIINSQITSNRRHGIVVHSQGLKIQQCDLQNNAGSGILYNPMFSKLEQRDLISWINLEERKKVIRIPDDVHGNISLNYDEYRYLVFTKTVAEKSFNILTTNGRSIGIVVLNPFRQSSSENMTIFGRLKREVDVTEWDLRENLTAFPLQTPGFGVIVDYFSGQNPSGQGIIYIASVDGQRHKAPWEMHPLIHIDSANIRDCKRGISSHHFNRDVSEQEDHFHRYTNETILITNTGISSSKSEAVFVWTPFWDPVIKNLAEINYTLINCTIHSNGKGILHYSRDIRNSNNLFHWTINNTDFVNNAGGIDIRLPYVWQYSENFTHSFSMHNCSLTRNRRFEFSISGHFARVNMSHNKFEENKCKKGILSFSGMEKEMLIVDNIISKNSAIFGVEFNLQSHANKFGLVPAYFQQNYVANNTDNGLNLREAYEPTSYGLAIRGVQLVNINRNILDNANMQFELLTGVLTGSIDNKINVGYNWWGSNDPVTIQERIFDFDDWNGYAIADINPYLGSADTNAGALPFNSTEQALIKVGRLSGRLYHNFRLKYRSEPYVIASDLTVMPGSTLTIEPGVIMEFQPSVGILVLGDVLARGTPERPILMRPTKYLMKEDRRFRRQLDLHKSRLCIEEKCDGKRKDGFLEIFNSTTEQWVPICDGRFTERNAQVVCKELGYSILNVHLSFGPRLEMGPTQTSRIRSWPHPLECVGTEKSLSDCEYRLNGYIDNYKCHHDGDFVYIHCGEEILPKDEEHWGGLRFSIASFETTDSPLNRPTLNYIAKDLSELEFVHIRGAGILHNEKSPALQLVQREIKMDFVNISESASHGLEIIGVSSNLAFNELKITNNLGIGVNILTLTGESTSRASKLGYDPLKSVDISYGIYGMVDICDTNKEMTVEDRILLYYKYDNQPVDCVKIFSSRHNGKQVGFRLLQFNLFNGTKYSAQPDNIKIYDGDVFNETSPVLGNIGWHFGTDSATNFYVSTDDTLSVLLHTIGGSGDNGFIAEVITVPISHLKTQDSVHNISYSEISNNTREGFAYRSAGEITPDITLRYSRINNNGRELFGNFTSGESAVALDVQNAKSFYFYNNLVMRNQGGLSIKVDSHTAVLGLHGVIVNNLFTENRNKEVLSLQGRKSGTFQWVNVFHNYFVRNYARYENTMLVSQVVANLTENIAYNNTGKHLLHVQGFKRVPLSFQICVKNWFWRNVATNDWDKSTIIASKAGQKFSYNYLVNPENDFELAARNRSIFTTTDSSVYATWNWWGFNERAAISGRIKDYSDSEELLSVTYEPFLHDNTSVLSGKCAGGWTKIGDTCFLYVGGVMTFAEAKKFCELDNASMPYVKTKHHELMDFVRQQQHYYQHYSDRFWIQSLDVPPRECAVLVNRKVVKHPCNEYFPFLCERDPEITVSTSLWFMEPLTIAFLSIAAFSLVFVALCLGFWLCKSKQRYREKLERRNSIRASIRSNRSLTGFSELGYKRRMERAFEAQSTPKTAQMKMNGSIDSVEKSASRFSCSMDDSYENTLGDTSSSRVANGDFSPFVRGYHPDAAHENGTANLMVHPTFDLTYENQCFVDRSASRNSHEISRDWSSSTGSTLDMKRALENKEQHYNVGPFNHQNTPSPPLTIESNGGSSRSSNRPPPLETAM